MTRYAMDSDALLDLLQLSTAPVAVQFRRETPADIPRATADLKG